MEGARALNRAFRGNKDPLCFLTNGEFIKSEDLISRGTYYSFMTVDNTIEDLEIFLDFTRDLSVVISKLGFSRSGYVCAKLDEILQMGCLELTFDGTVQGEFTT